MPMKLLVGTATLTMLQDRSAKSVRPVRPGPCRPQTPTGCT